MRRVVIGLAAVLVAAGALVGVESGSRTPASAQDAPTAMVTGETDLGTKAIEHELPLPSTKTLFEYEEMLFPWIRSREYATQLGWIMDKRVRDTGPYVKGIYYGTHPAVRIFYSPKVMYWLTGNPDYWPDGKAKGLAVPKKPREGAIPDGGMIVKEMFQPPAARYEEMSDEEIVATLYTPTSPGWTVMVKDSNGAPDGWFWASVWVGQHYDSPTTLDYPHAGFGLACNRCHAVAEEKGTFSALRNIKGFAGDPLAFFVDETWRKIPRALQPYTATHGPDLPAFQAREDPGPCVPNPEFLFTFDTMAKVCYEHVTLFPSEANDHVPKDPKADQEYLSSDQCMMCHSGANSRYSFGPIMFLETEIGGLNVSPYGEWRWSPMGLAGRDPIFHSQIESEISMLKDMLGGEAGQFYSDQLVNTCLRCHGATGKRTYDHDQGVGGEYWNEKAKMDLDWIYVTDQKDPRHKYAALMRDGISCMVCHRQVEDYPNIAEFLQNNITGQFASGPQNEVYGPFEKVVTKPMENATGLTPKYNPYIKTSRMCGSCHVVNLPVVDWPLDNPPGDDHMTEDQVQQLLASEKNPNFQGFLHRIEQATYLEWLNSMYQTEFGEPGPTAKNCQDCHMRTEYHSRDGKVRVDPIQTKIATIEDEDYPEADHRIPQADLTVQFRKEGFRRHTFQGLNIFLMEIFRQFNDVLGVRLTDFETGTNGLDFALDNYVTNARENTAKVEILKVETEGNRLEADVRVTNLAGHRLPSGVGFRRLFLEFVVFDEKAGRERVYWASGRTNGVGVLIDWDGHVLPEEFFEEYEEDGETRQHFHEHHNVITNMNQVQVYEELATDASGKITTSFIRRAHHLKDNRLLPIGWSKAGPSSDVPSAFLEATYPGHETEHDAEYQDGSGSDVVKYVATLPEGFDASQYKVRATLYSQAWAPYYLRDRFSNVPEGPDGDARRRLYYLASHLQTEGTEIEGWKFKIQSATWPRPEGEAAPAPAMTHPEEGEAPEDGECFGDENPAGKGCG